MSNTEDFLKRVDLTTLYSQEEWGSIVEQARYNLSHIPQILLEQWDLLNDYEYLKNVSDDDAVIITRLGTRILLGEKINELYMADSWKLLAENFVMQKRTENMKEPTVLPVPRTLYQNDQWTKSVASAKSILSKIPPSNHIQKWPILESEEFRNRMRSIDNNAVITLTIGVKLSKDQPIPAIYQTEDWELLEEMIKIVRGK